MNAAVIRFPGSNCDQDCFLALEQHGFDTRYVWHKDQSLGDPDLVVLPGGFSYGDYLRCGAIARFSPILRAVEAAARDGRLILGICNGFQILCEAGLLPGALVRNRSLRFLCHHVSLRVESADSPFTNACSKGEVLRIPIAHGEGNYRCDPETLDTLEKEDRILVRYTDANGHPTESSNPNGSTDNIAGICNATRNVFGLMPHPERAADPILGGTDGSRIFESIRNALASTAR